MKRVIIVSDRAENLHLLRALLQSHGYEVTEANNGDELLAKARKMPPDLVISDPVMAVMDGYALLNGWKSDAQLRKIPFVIYSVTDIDPLDEKLALHHGADAFINPAESGALPAVIEDVLARKAAPPSKEPDGKPLPKQLPSGVLHGNGEHILFLDDEEALVYLAKCFLEQLGYRVTGHTLATTALASFRANPGDFDLTITDLNMPGMSGLDVAQQLRNIKPDALIVLTSGCMRPEEIERAHALGIQSTVLKPNTIGQLCLIIQNLLKARAPGTNN